MTTQLSSSNPLVYPYPGIPHTWSASARERAAEVLRRCSAFIDGFDTHVAEPTIGADIEDFWEEAARAAAAHRAAEIRGNKIEHFSNSTEWTPERIQRRLGGVAMREEDDHAPDSLLGHELILKYGGRWMSIGALPEELDDQRPDNLFPQLVERYRAGVTHAVIKLAGRKNGLAKIELSDDPSVIRARLSEHDHIGWDMVRNGERGDWYLAQDFIPMTHEYRLFIVDGVLVSGAGCIEEFTPFNREDGAGPFDYRTRVSRGTLGAEGLDEPAHHGVVEEHLLPFGRKLAAEHGGTIVIDVALATDATGDLTVPVVIELNTLPNSGLYAGDVDTVYLALAGANDRGYGDYSLITTECTGFPMFAEILGGTVIPIDHLEESLDPLAAVAPITIVEPEGE